jgi:hypothetical protein
VSGLLVLLWLGLLGVVVWGALRLHVRARARARLWADAAPPHTLRDDAPEPGPLAHWLALAGFDDEGAPTLFLGATALAFAVGATLAWGLVRSGALQVGVAALESIPGGLGNALTPILSSAWVGVALLVAVAPALVVRAACRARVAEV